MALDDDGSPRKGVALLCGHLGVSARCRHAQIRDHRKKDASTIFCRCWWRTKPGAEMAAQFVRATTRRYLRLTHIGRARCSLRHYHICPWPIAAQLPHALDRRQGGVLLAGDGFDLKPASRDLAA